MIQSIKETYLDLLAFLKRPADQQDSEQKVSLKSKRLFSILAIDISLMGILLSIIYGIEQAGLIQLSGHKTVKLLQLLPIWGIVLFGALITPLIEELIFRLYLRLKQNYPAQLLFLFILVTGPKTKEGIKSYIETKWHNYYKGIFYFSALIFAFVHMANFEYSSALLIFFPILIAPQFIVGLLTGYLRVKYGLLWGFYLHGLHNLIFLSIPLIFMGGTVEKLNIANERYMLKIEEIGFGKLNSACSSFNVDSIYFDNYKLKTVLALLLEKEEKLIQFIPNEKSELKINLILESYSDTLNPKQIILNNLKSAYGFQIIKDDRLQETWELQITDTLVLRQHKNDSAKSSTVSFSSEEINMENVDLIKLVQTLNSNYDKYILTTLDMSDKFNFKFQKSGFDDLKNHLEREYGLILIKSETEIEYIMIDFIDNKINGTQKNKGH